MTGFSETLEAAQQGAPWALGALWREHQPALLRYLKAGNPGLAEDLASDAWLEAARGLPRFAGAEPDFRSYLFTIARHRLIDQRRQAARRKTQPVAWIEDRPAGGDPLGDIVDGLSPEGALATLRTLPAGQAEAVLLRVVAGLDVAQVARVMKKQPGTVRVLAHRGLKSLAERLTPAVAADAAGTLSSPV